MKPTPDAYDLALAQERQCWHALHNLRRTDPGYAAALSRWREAADSIGRAAEQLAKRKSPAAFPGISPVMAKGTSLGAGSKGGP